MNGTSIRVKEDETLINITGYYKCFLKIKKYMIPNYVFSFKDQTDKQIKLENDVPVYSMKDLIIMMRQSNSIRSIVCFNTLFKRILQDNELLSILLTQLYNRKQLNSKTGENTIDEIVHYWLDYFNISELNFIDLEKSDFQGTLLQTNNSKIIIDWEKYKNFIASLRGSFNAFVEYLYFFSAGRIDLTTDRIQDRGCLDITKCELAYTIILNQFEKLSTTKFSRDNIRVYDPTIQEFKKVEGE